MCCGQRAKATTTIVYVLSTPQGQRQEYASKSDAEAAKVLAGGGTITPVRK